MSSVPGIAFVLVTVLVPLLALFLERAGSVRLEERHHSHHDTYGAPVSFTRALTQTMVLMGFLGLLLAWACLSDAVSANPVAVLGFFDAFIVTLFVCWWDICRYKVSIFSDCMVVTPLAGPDVWVRFDQIERLRWWGLRDAPGSKGLDVYVGGRRAIRLHGLVDLEQILMRIDRFDVLTHTA